MVGIVGVTLIQFAAVLMGQAYYAVYQGYLVGMPGFPAATGDDAISQGRVMFAIGVPLAVVSVLAIVCGVRGLRHPKF